MAGVVRWARPNQAARRKAMALAALMPDARGLLPIDTDPRLLHEYQSMDRQQQQVQRVRQLIIEHCHDGNMFRITLGPAVVRNGNDDSDGIVWQVKWQRNHAQWAIDIQPHLPSTINGVRLESMVRIRQREATFRPRDTHVHGDGGESMAYVTCVVAPPPGSLPVPPYPMGLTVRHAIPINSAFILNNDNDEQLGTIVGASLNAPIPPAVDQVGFQLGNGVLLQEDSQLLTVGDMNEGDIVRNDVTGKMAYVYETPDQLNGSFELRPMRCNVDYPLSRKGHCCTVWQNVATDEACGIHVSGDKRTSGALSMENTLNIIAPMWSQAGWQVYR